MIRNRIKYGHCGERFCDEAICTHKDCFTIVRNDGYAGVIARKERRTNLFPHFPLIRGHLPYLPLIRGIKGV